MCAIDQGGSPGDNSHSLNENLQQSLALDSQFTAPISELLTITSGFQRSFRYIHSLSHIYFCVFYDWICVYGFILRVIDCPFKKPEVK